MKRRGTGRILTPAQYEELLEEVEARDERCWFHDVIPHACSGVGEAAHLIPQSDLKRHFSHGVVRRKVRHYRDSRDGGFTIEDRWVPRSRIDVCSPYDDKLELWQLARDARNVVFACSFIHGIFDRGFYRHKALDFPRALLEPRFEAYVSEFGMERLASKRFPVFAPDDFDNPLGIEQDPSEEYA